MNHCPHSFHLDGNCLPATQDSPALAQNREAGPVQTSLGVSWRHRLLVHHSSRAATRQASKSPTARTQKTPAKLCSLRALPSAWALVWLVRSQRPVRGHHFCFSTSRSPLSCSSRILQDRTHVSHSPGLLPLAAPPHMAHHQLPCPAFPAHLLPRLHVYFPKHRSGLSLSPQNSKAPRPALLSTPPCPTSQG